MGAFDRNQTHSWQASTPNDSDTLAIVPHSWQASTPNDSDTLAIVPHSWQASTPNDSDTLAIVPLYCASISLKLPFNSLSVNPPKKY